jgi:PAS domain S-box-containing protein
MNAANARRKKPPQWSDDKFGVILDYAGDGLCVHDLDGRVLYVNKCLCERLGYTRDELLAMSPAVLDTPEYAKTVPARIREVLDNGRAFFESAHRTRDGRVIPVEVNSRIIMFEGKKAVLSIARDITERKMAEESLGKSEALYRALIETTGTGYVVLDEKGNVIDANAEYVRMAGRARLDEIRGKRVLDWTAPYAKEKNGMAIEECFRKGFIRNFEIDYVGPSGTTTHVEINATVVDDQGSKRILTLCRDISPRKKNEEHARVQHNLGVALSAAPGLDRGLELCLEAALRVSGMDSGGIYLADKNTGDLDLMCHVGLSREFVGSVSKYPKDSPSAQLVYTAKAQYANYGKISLPLDGPRKNEGLKAIAIVPFCHESSVIGCLNIASHVIDEVAEHARFALEIIAIQIGNAVARLRAEAELRESEARYRTVTSLTSDYVFRVVIGTDERVVMSYVTGNFFSATGRALQEVRTPDLWSKVIHPDDIGNIHAVLRRLVSSGGLGECECRSFTKDGVMRWVHVVAQAVRKGAGLRTTEIIGAVKDISERKKAEEALRASEETFRRMIQGAPDAIFVQTDGCFALVNEAACRLFGAASAKELLGTLCIDRIHPDFRDLIRQRILSINKERKPNPVLDHEIFLRIDGSPLTAEVSDVPVQFQGKSGALVFIRDITQRKRTEEALQNAQKLESIGVLAGGIAHDFNNLLSGMFGNMDLARLFLSEGNHQEALTTISRAMTVFDRARNLTQQLLTFSKGGAPLRKTITLEPLLRDTVKFALSGSTVECTFSLSPDLWQCNVDQNQIGQVIDNIVINALQAMPAGGTIAVSAQNMAVEQGAHTILRQGNYVKISIADSGVGIPKEIVRRIFDPFFTTKQKGSGLGLAISYSIVKRHEGAIEVESEPGKGTTFHLSLPASSAATNGGKNAAPQEFKGQGRVLIVDDERFILDVAARMLEGLGFTAVTVPHGDEAIRIVKEEKAAGRAFAVAILDLTIPGRRGGKDTVKPLLAVDPSIKVIVSSGYSDDPVMADPARYGFSACLNKPYTIEEIKKVLRSLAPKSS